MSVGQGGASPGGPGEHDVPPRAAAGPAPDPFTYPPVYRPDSSTATGRPGPTGPYAAPGSPEPYGGAEGYGPYGGYGQYQTGYGPPAFPGWGPPLPPPLPPQRRRRGTLVGVAAAAVVAALAVAAVAVGINRSHSGDLSPADSRALTASRAKIVAELPRLQAWISQDRGLPYAKPVSPEVLSDTDFVRALNSGGGSPADLPGDPDDIGTTFAAMGLVKDADTFYGADDAASAADVDGFYDDATGRLVVRGTAWTPSMEYTLVHELTHALQDQTFELSRLEASARTDDETILTIRALVEGDAERVADDYYDQQTTAWQDAVDADQGSGSASSTPIVDVYEGVPYIFGETFVDGLVAAGGNDAVDAAFRKPPTTSAQIVHPDRFFAGTLPAPTPPPAPKAPAGDLADTGVLGQLGLWAAVDAANPKPADTVKLDGWMGDSYVSTDGDSGVCFVDAARFSSPQTRATAVAFLKKWTDAQHISVVLDGDTGLRLSACKA